MTRPMAEAHYDGADHFHADDDTPCGSYDVRCHCKGKGRTYSRRPLGALDGTDEP